MKSGWQTTRWFYFLADNGGLCRDTWRNKPETKIPGPKEDYSHVGPGWARRRTLSFPALQSSICHGKPVLPVAVAPLAKTFRPEPDRSSLSHHRLLATVLRIVGGRTIPASTRRLVEPTIPLGRANDCCRSSRAAATPHWQTKIYWHFGRPTVPLRHGLKLSPGTNTPKAGTL